MNGETIEITKDNLKLLEVAYDKAKADNMKCFTFNESEMLTSYAKYLIKNIRMSLCVRG